MAIRIAVLLSGLMLSGCDSGQPETDLVWGVWVRAGGPIDDSIFPQRMLVDYARVYELAAQ